MRSFFFSEPSSGLRTRSSKQLLSLSVESPEKTRQRSIDAESSPARRNRGERVDGGDVCAEVSAQVELLDCLRGCEDEGTRNKDGEYERHDEQGCLEEEECLEDDECWRDDPKSRNLAVLQITQRNGGRAVLPREDSVVEDRAGFESDASHAAPESRISVNSPDGCSARVNNGAMTQPEVGSAFSSAGMDTAAENARARASSEEGDRSCSSVEQRGNCGLSRQTREARCSDAAVLSTLHQLLGLASPSEAAGTTAAASAPLDGAEQEAEERCHLGAAPRLLSSRVSGLTDRERSRDSAGGLSRSGCSLQPPWGGEHNSQKWWEERSNTRVVQLHSRSGNAAPGCEEAGKLRLGQEGGKPQGTGQNSRQLWHKNLRVVGGQGRPRRRWDPQDVHSQREGARGGGCACCDMAADMKRDGKSACGKGDHGSDSLTVPSGIDGRGTARPTKNKFSSQQRKLGAGIT